MSESGGVSLLGLAFVASVVLAVLKIAGPLAALSWWTVAAPFLIVLALGVVISVVVILVVVLFDR